jgi:hypothetical protein
MPQPRGCHGRRRSLRASAGRAAGAAALIAGVLIAGVPASAQTLTPEGSDLHLVLDMIRSAKATFNDNRE